MARTTRSTTTASTQATSQQVDSDAATAAATTATAAIIAAAAAAKGPAKEVKKAKVAHRRSPSTSTIDSHEFRDSEHTLEREKELSVESRVRRSNRPAKLKQLVDLTSRSPSAKSPGGKASSVPLPSAQSQLKEKVKEKVIEKPLKKQSKRPRKKSPSPPTPEEAAQETVIKFFSCVEFEGFNHQPLFRQFRAIKVKEITYKLLSNLATLPDVKRYYHGADLGPSENPREDSWVHVNSTTRQQKKITDIINPFLVYESAIDEAYEAIRSLCVSHMIAKRNEVTVEHFTKFFPVNSPPKALEGVSLAHSAPLATPATPIALQNALQKKKKSRKSATTRQLVVLSDTEELEESTGDFSKELTKRWLCQLPSCRNHTKLCYTIAGKNRELAISHHPISTQLAKIWHKKIIEDEGEQQGSGGKAAEQPPAALFLKICAVTNTGVKEKANRREKPRYSPPRSLQQPPYYPHLPYYYGPPPYALPPGPPLAQAAPAAMPQSSPLRPSNDPSAQLTRFFTWVSHRIEFNDYQAQLFRVQGALVDDAFDLECLRKGDVSKEWWNLQAFPIGLRARLQRVIREFIREDDISSSEPQSS